MLSGRLTVVAGLGGTFIGGYLGDWLSGRMKNGQLWLAGISTIAAIISGMVGAACDIGARIYIWFSWPNSSCSSARPSQCRRCQCRTGDRARLGDGGVHFREFTY